jgi:PAS domain S-box-containing protein
VFDYVIDNDRKRLAGNLSNVVEVGVRRSTEYTAIRRDGRTVPVEASSVVIRDAKGQPKAVMAVIRDITERKEIEEALRQSERRFRNYFEQGLIGMAVTSVDKCWLEVNDRLCEILGYRREELKQKTWTEMTHPDDLAKNLQVFNRLLAGNIEYFTFDKRYIKKDGSIVYTTIHTRAFRKEDETIDHIVLLVEDITERKQAQDALERERLSLWKMLQASDHERQIISYDIHDGLAQYLAAAGMQLQVHDALKEKSPDEAKRAYDAAAQLVRQSHSEARRLISEVRPPIIDEIGLETAISHLVHEQRERGGPKVECRSDVQFGRLPAILENALYRIAQEALTNACKHSKSKNVMVTMSQERQDVRLEVRDWGIGFDPESVEKGHFGLEGIRQRVRLLGGRLTIESTPGSGTVVQVVVPIVEKQIEE